MPKGARSLFFYDDQGRLPVVPSTILQDDDAWKDRHQTQADPKKQAAFDQAFKENVTDKS